MSKKILQLVVISLGILIILAFLTLIYGMYLKISTSSNDIVNLYNFNSLELKNDERIRDIKVIDKNNLLIIIENTNNIKAGIYDINNNKIIRYIER